MNCLFHHQDVIEEYFANSIVIDAALTQPEHVILAVVGC